MLSVATVEFEGKRYRLTELGYMEHDTNAWVETGDCVVTCLDTGEELEEDELDELVESDTTLFEELCSLADWKLEYE